MGFDHEVVAVENREAVDDVGAKGGVDVVRRVLSFSGSVPGPVGEVADHLVPGA